MDLGTCGYPLERSITGYLLCPQCKSPHLLRVMTTLRCDMCGWEEGKQPEPIDTG